MMEAETRTPLSSNKIIGISALLGPFFGLITSFFFMLISMALHGATPNLGLILPTMLLGAYVIGFVPALVGGMIFSVLRKFTGHGFLTAFVSGFFGVFLFMTAKSFISSSSDLLLLAQMSIRLGSIPAILLFAVSVKVLKADISAFRKPKIPVNIGTALFVSFILYVLLFFIANFIRWA